jgi:hypothetical protein
MISSEYRFTFSGSCSKRRRSGEGFKTRSAAACEAAVRAQARCDIQQPTWPGLIGR